MNFSVKANPELCWQGANQGSLAPLNQQRQTSKQQRQNRMSRQMELEPQARGHVPLASRGQRMKARARSAPDV